MSLLDRFRRSAGAVVAVDPTPPLPALPPVRSLEEIARDERFAAMERALLRAATAPIHFTPQGSELWGNTGWTTQPETSLLLAESIGVPDLAGRKIADRIASLEFQVYRKTGDRRGRGPQTHKTEYQQVFNHPLVRILERPHPSYSWRSLVRLLSQWIVQTGQGYLLKVGNQLGVPVELHPMPPANVVPLVSFGVTEGYLVTDGYGQTRAYPANVIIRAFWPDPENPWNARGFLGPNGIMADAHKFAIQSIRKHYKDNATPPLVMQAKESAVDFTDAQKERFRELWTQLYSNRTGNTRAPAFIPTDWELKELFVQTGAELTPLLDFETRFLFMVYGVPRSVCGEVVSGDRSSAEANRFVFDLHTVTPIVELICDTLTQQLALDFGPDLVIDTEEFIQETPERRLDQEKSDLDRKVVTINEVREERGFDPVDWGDLPVGSSTDKPYDGTEPPPPTIVAAPPGAPGDQAPPPKGSQDQQPQKVPADATVHEMLSDSALRAAERREHAAIRARYAARRRAHENHSELKGSSLHAVAD